jgi:uncharacterized protein with PQ loop repeat
MVEVLAWCGAALSCLVSVPQAIRVLRAERLVGISASTYVIVLCNAAIWAAWSVITREYAAGIPGLINGPAAILVLHRLMIAHRGGAHQEVRWQLAQTPDPKPALEFMTHAWPTHGPCG